MTAFLAICDASHRSRDPARRAVCRAAATLGLGSTEPWRLGPVTAWLYNRAAEDVPVSVAEEGRLGVICYGGDRYGSPRPYSATIARAFREGGVQEVSRLPGCFGALIVDGDADTIHLACDLTGHRRLYLHEAPGRLLAASHDLLLAACVGGELDLRVASSIVAHDWSVRARSMLRGVRGIGPDGRWSWSPSGGLRRTAQPLADGEARVPHGDSAGIARLREELLAIARQDARSFADSAGELRADLSAGSDSRAVAALLLDAAPPERVRFRCSGYAEAQTARRVARRMGARLDVSLPSDEGADDFEANLTLLAFTMNGDANGKLAAGPALREPAGSPPKANGLGGEIFSGFYYRPVPRLGRELPAPLLRWMFSRMERTRLAHVSWADRTPLEAALADKRARLEALRQESGCWFDALDAFYLLERWGVWGAQPDRIAYGAQWSPFANPDLIRAFMRLPNPRADHARFNAYVVQSLQPSVYWIPINDTQLFAFDGAGVARSLARAASFGAGPLRARLRSPVAPTDEQARGHMLRERHADRAGELLCSRGSVTRQLLGAAGAQQLWTSHFVLRQDRTHLLGTLLTMERWRELLERVTHV